jgi:hypothetical protein
MSTLREELEAREREFVGLTRLSWAAAAAMLRTFITFVEAADSARMEYDTDALVVVAQSYQIERFTSAAHTARRSRCA